MFPGGVLWGGACGLSRKGRLGSGPWELRFLDSGNGEIGL